jgi:tetratricopeptide (TPR) repeat protein
MEALLCYERALRLSPKNETVLYGLGNWFFAQKQMEEAIKYYNQVLETNPKMKLALWNKCERKRVFFVTIF